METIFSKTYSFKTALASMTNTVEIIIKKSGNLFLFADDKWDSIDEIIAYIPRYVGKESATEVIDDIKKSLEPKLEVESEKVIAQFEEVLNGKTAQVQAVVEGNFLTYYHLNKFGERDEVANDEGNGLLMVEKNTNQDFVFGSKTIHKTHYQNPKQFFGLLKSIAKFNDAVMKAQSL